MHNFKFLFLALCLWAVEAHAANYYVSTGGSGTECSIGSPCSLSTAIGATSPAGAGDTIFVNDGTYTGQFSSGKGGSAGNPITLKALNQHIAILQGTDNCVNATPILYFTHNNWTIDGFLIQNTGRGIMTEPADNITIRNNIFKNFHVDGVAFYTGSDNNLLENNVFAYGDACNGSYDGQLTIHESSSNTIRQNIFIGGGNNGYALASANGTGIIVQTTCCDVPTASQNNLIQGNLLLQEGGRGAQRFLNASGNTFRDNITLFGGSGGTGDSSNCSDDSNQFLNNIFYGQYYAQSSSKGQMDIGGAGNHTWKNNLFWTNDFTRIGVSHESGDSGGVDPDTCEPGYKVGLTMTDNLFYSPIAMGTVRQLLRLSNYAAQITLSNYNLFYAPSGTTTLNYTFGGNDVQSQPVFVDAAKGDFTLTPASPGKNAGSTGADIGVSYNQYLRKIWLRKSFELPIDENTGLTTATSTSFSVSTAHFYQVFFYIPSADICNRSAEIFTIEGDSTNLTRDINSLVGDPTWLDGVSRYITLGKHKATDGTLNISWQTTNCVEKIFIRQIPTETEAFAWLSLTDGRLDASSRSSASSRSDAIGRTQASGRNQVQ